jgi:hypothetical protein
MDCPRCSTPDVIEIRHVLPDGSEVWFSSCSRCEEKTWWDGSGEIMDLTRVLEIVRQNRK